MKNLTIALLASAALAATTLTACDPSVTGPTTTVERNVSGFNRVHVEDGLDVEVRKGATEGLTIEAPEGALSHIITRVDGNTLRVYIDDQIGTNFSPRKIIIDARSLEGIEISGGTELTGVGTFDANTFTISESGGSRATLHVVAQRVEIDASGGSELTLKGSSDVADINSFSGGSRMKGYDFATHETEVDASGGSRVDIYASDRLDVSASGGSSIHYKGHPTVTSDLSGGSQVVDEN